MCLPARWRCSRPLHSVSWSRGRRGSDEHPRGSRRPLFLPRQLCDAKNGFGVVPFSGPLHSGWFVAWGFDEPLLAFSIKKEELDGELEAPRQYRRKEASNHRSTIGCAGSSGCGKDGDCRFDHETGGDSSGTSCHRHPDAWVSA